MYGTKRFMDLGKLNIYAYGGSLLGSSQIYITVPAASKN